MVTMLTGVPKRSEYIYSSPLATTENERQELQEIERILFPNGAKSESERNDASIVFTAGKYQTILVTNDGGSKRQPGGIIGKREELKRRGIQIMTDGEAVAYVVSRIQQRDRLAKERAVKFGQDLPWWVGRD